MVVCEVCCLICSTSENKKNPLMLHEELLLPWQTAVKCSALEVGRILRPLRHLSTVDRARVRKHAAFPEVQTEASGVLQPQSA